MEDRNYVLQIERGELVKKNIGQKLLVENFWSKIIGQKLLVKNYWSKNYWSKIIGQKIIGQKLFIEK